jgi:hypothetical protein
MDRGDDIVLLEALGEASYRRGHLPGVIRLQDTGAAAEVVPDQEAFSSSLTVPTSTETP